MAEPVPGGPPPAPDAGKTPGPTPPAPVARAPGAAPAPAAATPAATTPPAAPPAAKPAPAKPAPPAKPAAPAAKEPGGAPLPPPIPLGTASVTRRGFLSSLGWGWAAFTAACATGAAATLRFMFPNVLYEPPMTLRVGKVEDFLKGAVDERFKQAFGTWIVRTDEGLYALSTICTHFGCTPNWLEAEKKFKCPCHGSGFRMSGINFEGPAPRPLERFRVTRDENGTIVVDKSRIFQQEKGQWSDPEAFLKV